MIDTLLLIFGEDITSTQAQILDTMSWDFYIKFLLAVLGISGIIVAALLILFSKRKEDIQLTESKRADANANLVKTRDQELTDKIKEALEYKDELDSITVEYRTLAGINLKELFEFWQRKEEFEGRFAIQESENRRLKLVVDYYEQQYGKPKS